MTAQPTTKSTFLYPDSPVYDAGPQGNQQQQGDRAAPQPVTSAPFLFPDNPQYATAAPSLPSMDGGEQTSRIAIVNPAFTAAQSPAHELVPQAGQPVSVTIPAATDGSAINVQIDASLSPVSPVDNGTPADGDGFTVALMLDPPDALTKALPSGTKVTITPRWSTSDGRTIAAGRAQAIVYLRAVTVKA